MPEYFQIPKIDVFPPGVSHVDEEDSQNLFMVSENVRDIYTYLRYLEKAQPVKEDSLKVSIRVFLTPLDLLDKNVFISGLYGNSQNEGSSYQLAHGGSSTVQTVTGGVL